MRPRRLCATPPPPRALDDGRSLLRAKRRGPHRRGGALGHATAFGSPRQGHRVTRAVNRVTAFMARPYFVALMGVGIAGWIGANLIASAFGLQAIDTPAFQWLQGAANLFSLFIVMLVLVAQKHEDELNAHRDTLTLELAILSEHKIAKVIQLLEELRRDSPHVQDRVDHQADQMAEPADTGSVLAATRANNGP